MNQQPMGAPQPKVRAWLWIVLIVVVLAAGGTAAWYYLMGPGKKATTTTTPTSTTTTPSTSTTTNSTTSTADWKTYTNTKYGYSIKYPKDWTANELTQDAPITSAKPTSDSIYLQPSNDNLAYIKIWKDPRTSKATFVNEYEATIVSPKKQDVTLGNASSTEISGTIKPNNIGEGEGVIYYITENNNNLIGISVSTEQNYTKLKQTINTILSTFQFTQ